MTGRGPRSRELFIIGAPPEDAQTEPSAEEPMADPSIKDAIPPAPAGAVADTAIKDAMLPAPAGSTVVAVARPDPDRVLLRYSQLPPAVQEFLTEMEMVEGTPAESYILGYILRHLERGELSWKPSPASLESIYGPAQAERLRGLVPVDKPAGVAGTAGTCGWCGQEFVVSRLGQKYCPDPGPEEDRESCGKQAARRDRHEAAVARGDRRYTQASAEHGRIRAALDAHAQVDPRGRVIHRQVPE